MAMTRFTLGVILVVLVVEVVAAYYAVKYQRLRRLIASTKTTRIADVGDGFHRIGGRVLALGQAFTSPYGEKGCVYYDLLVERMRSVRRNPYESNDGEPEWDELIKEERMQRFGVDDGSGVAVVDLENASIELTSDNDFDPDRKPEMARMSTFNRDRLLKRYGMESPAGKNKGSLRYRERLLEEGVQVQVMGEPHGTDNGRPLFIAQGQPLRVFDYSEDALRELYDNKLAFSIVAIISIPLGVWLFFAFWLP